MSFRAVLSTCAYSLSVFGSSLLVAEELESNQILIIRNEGQKEETKTQQKEEVVAENTDGKKKQKKAKPHFAGSKKPAPEEPKKGDKLKNEWVVSKTYPKNRKKKEENKGAEALLAIQNEKTPPARPLVVASSSKASTQTSISERLDDLQSQVNFLSDEVHATHAKPIAKAPNGFFFVFAEWLFWTTKEEGTAFALSTNSESPGSLNGAEAHAMHFSWNSGVRGGIGFHLPQDHWDVTVTYTNFRPSSTESAEGAIAPLFIYQGSSSDFDIVQRATSTWYITFQTADLQIGKEWPVAQRLLLRPFIGIRGAWIHQKVDLAYYERIGDKPYSMHGRNPFRGVGGLVGCDSNWQLGSGMSFYANGAIALLAGRFDLHQTQTLPLGTNTVAWQDHWRSLNPMVQYVTGIAWDRNFYRNKWHVGVQLGFEAQYWWSQNQMPIFTDDILPTYVHAQGSLAFYGLDLGFRFDF